MLKRKPDFVVVGTQKGGTTSLFRYLVQHPSVLRSRKKEVDFFTDDYGKGTSWYSDQFPSRIERLRASLRHRSRTLTGEATPYYLFHPLAPARIQAYCPDAKIIMMLRDPVERAYSHYKHHKKLGEETLDFASAIDAEDDRLAGELDKLATDASYVANNYRLYSYKARGRYVEQLERWLATYPKESLLILHSEEFFADPAAGFLQVQRFLNLPVHERETYEVFNPGKRSDIAPEVRASLVDYFRPYNQRLYDLLDVDYRWGE